jgi:hypothetical protein
LLIQTNAKAIKEEKERKRRQKEMSLTFMPDLFISSSGIHKLDEQTKKEVNSL